MVSDNCIQKRIFLEFCYSRNILFHLLIMLKIIYPFYVLLCVTTYLINFFMYKMM